MSAHSFAPPPPIRCATCPERDLLLTAYRCRQVTGPRWLRLRDATCCLPPDVRRETVRALAMSDGRRAGLLAKHFGLEYRGLLVE